MILKIYSELEHKEQKLIDTNVIYKIVTYYQKNRLEE
jgi:hypothetical protein